MLRSSRSFFAFPILASLLWSSLGHAAGSVPSYPACTKEPTESDVTAAKGAFQAGNVSFSEADYERAILYWEDAFRRDCTAAPLLLNLSRAYELSGQKKAAIVALETFLERRPQHEDRAALEKRITALKKQVADEENKPSEEPAAAPVEKEPAQEKPAEPEDSDSGFNKPLWPVFLTAGGVTLTLVGLGIAAPAQKKIDACTKNNAGDLVCGSPQELQEAQDAQGVRNLGGVMALTGIAAAATGGVFWIVLWNGDDEASKTARKFQPQVAPGYAGLRFSTSF